MFNAQADFTIKGNEPANFIIDGDVNDFEYPLISTDNSDITLEYVTMQSYTNSSLDSSNPAGGAISFNCTDKTLSLKNCNFTNVITTIMPNDDFAIGAIYFGNGNLILDNCSFTQDGENVVDLYCSPDATSNITLKRNITLPIIQYANTNLNGDLQITLNSTFNSDEIKVYVDNISGDYDTELFTLNDGQPLPKCFTLLNEDYEFDYTNGKIVEKTAGGTGGGGSGNEITINSQNYSNYFNESFYVLPTGIYNVTENITFDYPIKIENGSDVTIKAITNNVTLTQPTNKNLIHVANGGNLTLGGGAKMLTLKGANNASDKIIYINCGTVKLTEGCTIDGVQSSSSSNVYAIVMTGGTFEMAGGTIQNHKIGSIISNDVNSALGNCIINIYGGEILNNKSTANGGVINLKSKSTTSTVNIYGTVSIHDNACASNNNGGSIYTTGANTVNINISDYVNNASIYDNCKGTTKQGASIYKNNNSTVTIMDYTLTSGLYEKNIINGVAQE